MPRDVLTLRVDARTRRRLAVVARREGRTASDVARRALDAGLDQAEQAAAGAPFAAIADLVGSVRGGDARRSTRGARAIATTLRARARPTRKQR